MDGRSSIFELLGIDAGKEEEDLKPGNYSIREAFRRFLQTVSTLDEQRIAHFQTYSKSDVPTSVWQQTPLLLDPSNPYNNFIKRFPPEARAVFKARAAESLRRLKNVHSASDFQNVVCSAIKWIQSKELNLTGRYCLSKLLQFSFIFVTWFSDYFEGK